MKCLECQSLLPTYVDEETSSADNPRVEAHLQHCTECQGLYALIKDEVELIRDGWSMETLPDDFASEVMQQIVVKGTEVERVNERPIKSKSSIKRKRLMKRISSLVASAILLLILGTYVSPTFASYLSSFFQTVKGELGLRQAAKQGFSTEINQEVSNNGITLRVKEVVADPTRVVLSYVLEDSKGQMLPDLYFPTREPNNLYVTDTEGKVIPSYAIFRRTNTYADLVFPLQNPPAQVVVHLEITGIGSFKKLQEANLTMSIPVDLSQGIAATRQIQVDQRYTNENGFTVELPQVTYAPSATQLYVQTHWDNGSMEKIQQQIEDLQAKGVESEVAMKLLDSYSVAFTIENKEGNVIVDSQKNNYDTDTGLISTEIYSDEQKKGSIKWSHSFAPLAESSEDLFFHLNEVVVTQKANFSLTIPLHNKGKRGGEYEGNNYEVQGIQEKLSSTSNLSSYMVTINSIQKVDDFPSWLVTDKEGRTYKSEVNPDKTKYYSYAKRHHTVQTLIVKEVPKGVNELTLSLVTVQKPLPQVDWKIKLPR